MTVPSVSCEARKVAYRQTKDGLVVAFVIHPNDMPDALAIAPLGQRYMLALAAIGDDEKPIPAKTTPEPVLTTDSAEYKAAMASLRGKERYKESTPMQQALIRAARLPKDDRFRAWLASEWSVSSVTEDSAIAYIQRECCEGESRSTIATDEACYERFLMLETDWKVAVGEIPEVR